MIFILGFSYIFIMSIVGVAVMFYDKQCAKKGTHRVSELTLWRIAWFGGAVGCTLGMHLFKHKTKKGHFSIGFPMIGGIYCCGLLLLSFLI